MKGKVSFDDDHPRKESAIRFSLAISKILTACLIKAIESKVKSEIQLQGVERFEEEYFHCFCNSCTVNQLRCPAKGASSPTIMVQVEVAIKKFQEISIF